MNALLADFQLGEVTEITLPPLTDEQMRDRYRSCIATIHPGSGEGFGYPIFESLACGVPAIHGNYGGGASILKTCAPEACLVNPRWGRIEGQNNCIRPVYDPNDWAPAVLNVLAFNISPASWSGLVAHLDWKNLQHPWKRWFKDGL